MDLYFVDERLAEVCASEREMKRMFGPLRARRLGVRLQQLRSAETLADVRLMTNRCHRLTRDLRGSFALDLDGPFRLLFRALDEDGRPTCPDDWSTVRAVLIDRVEDYH